MEKIFNSLYPNNESSVFSFKRKFPFEKRYAEAARIRKKYPDRIPIICQRMGDNIPDLDRKKYLVPADLTMGQFVYIIRQRMTLGPELGIYLFVGENSCIPNNTVLMEHIYHQHADDDNFLYINYSGENTFG